MITTEEMEAEIGCASVAVHEKRQRTFVVARWPDRRGHAVEVLAPDGVETRTKAIAWLSKWHARANQK